METDPPPRRLTSEQRTERQKRAAIDGESARKEYQASVATSDEKTARLRALRLERDRLELETTGPVPAKAPRAAAVKRVRRNIPIR